VKFLCVCYITILNTTYHVDEKKGNNRLSLNRKLCIELIHIFNLEFIIETLSVAHLSFVRSVARSFVRPHFKTNKTEKTQILVSRHQVTRTTLLHNTLLTRIQPVAVAVLENYHSN